jgi:6-carboxyhexanoate--CoA ligase
MSAELFSIRMRASRGRRHISGAEHLAPAAAVETLAEALTRRAMTHPRGGPDDIRISVEAIDPVTLLYRRLPDVTTVRVADVAQGRRAALGELVRAGVAEAAARRAMATLAAGAAPDGGSMRGAMLVDAETGERLEPDRARGVRVSRMDYTAEAAGELRRGLSALGLDNPHVREALVLAAKVLSAPGIAAELCWSDDPDYTAGYVAAPARGYVRFPHLKPRGEERGGRAFFVRREGLELTELIDFLERRPLLVDAVGILDGTSAWEEA